MSEIFGEYVQKPVSVQAAYLRIEDIEKIGAWLYGPETKLFLSRYFAGRFTLMTNKGDIRGKFGDWVIKSDDGSISVVPGEIFRKMFEPRDVHFSNIEELFSKTRADYHNPDTPVNTAMEYIPEPCVGPQGASGVSKTRDTRLREVFGEPGVFFPPYDQ